MTVNAREARVCVAEKQKRTSGQTRTNHQFQNMNEITDNIRQRMLYLPPSQECKKINRIQYLTKVSTPLTFL